MTLFKRSVSTRGMAAFVTEVLIISGSVALAVRLQGAGSDAGSLLWKSALTAGLVQLCLYYNDFYDLTLVHSSRELVVRLLQAAGATAIILAALYVMMPALDLGSTVVITSLCLVLGALLVWRLVFNRVSGVHHLEERILFVGTGSAARTVAREILSQHDFPYRIVGFVDDDRSAPGRLAARPLVLGPLESIPELVQRHDVTRIVVGLSDRRGHLPLQELLQAKLAGIRVEEASATYERLTGKVLVDTLRPSWLIFSDGFRVSRATRTLKRLGDVVFAIFGLAVGAPLMALTALAVALESGHPVLYRQVRVGQFGRPFTLFKFRSMRHDAESGTPVWATDGDDRVTRVGRFMRKTRLDELPQLWNVLRGDMSFVGPRPERPFFVEQLTARIPFYLQRHAVKPGVTGWAQVKYRYGSSVEDALEKLRYDLYYIKNLSLFFDLTILFDTVKVILFAKGAK